MSLYWILAACEFMALIFKNSWKYSCSLHYLLISAFSTTDCPPRGSLGLICLSHCSNFRAQHRPWHTITVQ